MLRWRLGRFFSGTVVDLAKARGVSAAVDASKKSRSQPPQKLEPDKVFAVQNQQEKELAACSTAVFSPRMSAATGLLRGEAEVCSERCLQGRPIRASSREAVAAFLDFRRPRPRLGRLRPAGPSASVAEVPRKNHRRSRLAAGMGLFVAAGAVLARREPSSRRWLQVPFDAFDAFS